MNNVHHMIWVPGWTYADSEKPVVAYFRKKVVLSGKVKYIDLKISADTRYKLYINGTFVQCGPQKGNLESWHFDRMAESTFLREGENVIAIEVLRFPENPDKRNRSLLIGPKPFLYIEGLIKTTDVEIKLDCGNDWRCERASHVKLKREPFIPAPIHGIEEVHGKPFFTGWKTAEYDDSTWEMAVEAIAESEFLSCAGQMNMQERTIPYQKTKEQRFTDVVCVREPVWEEQRIRTAVKKLLDKDVALRIPANTKWVVEITAGELMCGFLQLAMRGGKGAKIKMLCSESYSREGEAGPVKEDRTDYIHGQLRGAENNTDGRSDCHAWGSLVLYELPSVILGVRPAAPGYEKISVAPVPGYLDRAEGDVVTPRGMVHVSWEKDRQGNMTVEYSIEEKREEAIAFTNPRCTMCV